MTHRWFRASVTAALSFVLWGLGSGNLFAWQAPAEPPQPAPPKPGWKRLLPDAEVWIDLPAKTVVLGAEVSCREGPLEMFACPKNTKEYESVVAVNSKAYAVHTALLAVGAQPGNPVQFMPDYVPAKGAPIDVYVQWIDEEGTHSQSSRPGVDQEHRHRRRDAARLGVCRERLLAGSRNG